MTRPWFHVTWNTYGSWLPGDPRGFRDHDHRVHSSGDYLNPPPPGEHALLHQFASRTMEREAIVLSVESRAVVSEAVIRRAMGMRADPLALAVCSTHVHFLARFDRDRIGVEVGMLKREAAKALLKEHPGGVWSKRCHPRPIYEQSHLHKAFVYIVEHGRSEGAVVWKFRDECPCGSLPNA